jgi:hypothetical protein
MHCVVRAVEPSAIDHLDGDEIVSVLPRVRDSANTVRLEKSWHGLHYLLTGRAAESGEQLGFLLEGGTEVGEDLGYGPARAFYPEEVQRLSAALTGISDDELWSRYDPEQMEAEDVYPGIWDEEESELREEYLEYFGQLKSLVQRAGKTNKALLIVLS